MKLAPVIKLDKRNMTTWQNFDDGAVTTNCDVIVFFLFMVNFQGPGRQIPDARSIKLTFSLKVTLYLTKAENRTKRSQIHTIALGKGF